MSRPHQGSMDRYAPAELANAHGPNESVSCWLSTKSLLTIFLTLLFLITMTSVPVQQIVSMAQQRRGSDYRWTGIVALGVLLLLGLVLVLADAPPAPLAAGVPAAQFSAERALKHVEAIAAAPHPVGSAGHIEVENYITTTLRQIGLTPQVQKATGRDRWIDMPMPLENIVADLKGSTPGKSVLL